LAIDFDLEVTADDHRFQFRMVYICWNDGAGRRHLRANELRGDLHAELRAEPFSPMLAQEQCVGWILRESIQLHRLAQSDELHLGRDDALARVVRLADIFTIACAARTSLENAARELIGRSDADGRTRN